MVGANLLAAPRGYTTLDGTKRPVQLKHAYSSHVLARHTVVGNSQIQSKQRGVCSEPKRRRKERLQRSPCLRVAVGSTIWSENLHRRASSQTRGLLPWDIPVGCPSDDQDVADGDGGSNEITDRGRLILDCLLTAAFAWIFWGV